MKDSKQPALSLAPDEPLELLTPEPSTLAVLTLSEAIPIWTKIRKQKNSLKPRTHESTAGFFAVLEKFFGPMRLKKITAGNLREYQIGRASNRLLTATGETHPWKKAVCNSTINHEIVALGKLLDHAGLWKDRLKPYYTPLKVSSWSPRPVIDADDETRLFELAVGHPEAELAYLVACITNNTGAAGCELRGLRMKNLVLREPTLDENDVDITPSFIYIPPEIVKNRYRDRKIPLNPKAKWAFEQVLKRALERGSCQVDHYLFPLREKMGVWDPARPASRSWLRKSWGHLVAIANVHGLRPHDMRHVFATRRLEAGASREALREVMGHESVKMTAYYSSFALQAKVDVVNCVKATPPAPKPKPRRDRSSSQHNLESKIDAMLESQKARDAAMAESMQTIAAAFKMFAMAQTSLAVPQDEKLDAIPQ